MKSPKSLAFLLALALAAVGALPAAAQTCPATPGSPTISALTNFERTLTLNSTLLSTITPNITADTLAALTGGALELREQLNYNPANNVLTSFFFVVAPGSPVPTNLAQIPFTSILATSALGICQIVVVNKPAPSAMFFGAIGNSSPSFFGPFTGEPAVFSFGFTYDSPPVVSNVTEVVAGTLAAYSATAAGSFTVFPLPGGTTPGTGAITISITGPGGASTANSFTSIQTFATLDASASASSNGGPLTFSWSPVDGFPLPGIQGATNGPVLQLTAMRIGHTYQLMLTVTDSKGLTATAIVTVICV
ncbi:MAG TPA: hypothetical protein VEV17_18825 [Bryobacteraceae bacterium]|nr:hypothetical protein [Bryobacteraceae bacterium]